MRADGMTCCWRYIPVVTVHVRLASIVKNKGKRVETYTGLPCLITETLSPVQRFRNQKPKLEKRGVVDCGQHVHCWSVPHPEESWHYFGIEALCRYWLIDRNTRD